MAHLPGFSKEIRELAGIPASLPLSPQAELCQNRAIGVDLGMNARRWTSLPSLFFEQAQGFGPKPFLWRKHGEVFKAWSWRETAENVAKLASALERIGVKPGERVALLSENRPEWAVADLAIMAIGAVSVPLYTTNTTRDHVYVLENSGAKAAVVSTAALAKAFLPAAVRQNILKDVIVIEPPALAQKLPLDLHAWSDIMLSTAAGVAALERKAAKLRRTDLACIIYTSGTGGAPKGVMLHHGSILHNCEGAIEVLRDFGLDGNRFLSFLPLSHAYGHMGDLFLPIAIGAEIFYAESLEKLSANMRETRPTVMLVVPRLFETIKGRIEAAMRKEGGAREKLLQKAVALGRKRMADPASLTLVERVQDKALELLVRRKVKARFGGRIKALVSGGAALNPGVGSFFTSLGIRVLQGYGQTEAGPLVSVNCPPKIKIDAVGPPVKNTEVRIAEDGEILVRGELVMQGYWRDEAATKDAIRDGWLHTGDIGRFDEDGHLKITDRKKDIIVFDKGDNISPQKVEGLLTLEPEIAQAMVYGDNRPHLVGLLVPDREWFDAWARSEGKPGDLAAVRDDPALHRALAGAVGRVNVNLSNLERVRRFAIAAEPFSAANEMMTPTLKIRRHAITRAYETILKNLY
jgi:long-chain acyl-CoA synthetase